MDNQFAAAMRGFARAILGNIPPCDKCTFRKGCSMDEFLLVDYCDNCKDAIVEQVMDFARMTEDETRVD